MRTPLILLIIILIFSGCGLEPSKREISKTVGVYYLDERFTTSQLLDRLEEKDITLYVNDDLTFELRSSKKYCFTDVKGTWTMESDLERRYYVFELNGSKRSSIHKEIWVKCDSYNGILHFSKDKDIEAKTKRRFW